MTTVRPIRARISNLATGATRVDVFDDIGEGGWFAEGLTAKSFANQLTGVTGPLEVHINSGGGDVWDGIGIKNAIEAYNGPVTTVVDGIAASIASVIAQAGTDRVMMPGSMMMIHDAHTVAAGNAEELTKTASVLNDVSANLAGIYARVAGGTAEDWRAAMKAETWYTAEQAVEAGLATRVGDGGAVLPAGLDLAQFASLPEPIAAQLRTLPQASAGKSDARRGKKRGGKKAARAGRRILGAETMPIADKALPVHHTATVNEPWDGPGAVAAMPGDDKVLRYCHAWMSPEAAAETPREGDNDADDQKTNFKFPHHKTEGGPANLAACRNGLARLDSASIPDGDRAGVEAHLRAHLADGGTSAADSTTHDHATLPAWLRASGERVTTTPERPAWLNTAEEAT